MRKIETIASVALFVVVFVVVFRIEDWAWATSRGLAIQYHLAAMETEWDQYSVPPNPEANLKGFVHHRDELVRLGYFEPRYFEVPVAPGVQNCKKLVDALSKQAGSRPMCAWTPGHGHMSVKVYASSNGMTQWERLLSQWH